MDRNYAWLCFIMINERSAKEFCCEDISLIENYEQAVNDQTQTWCLHHRAEILPCGEFRRDVLKKFRLYYNRPAAELVFLTKAEHNRLHNSWNKRIKPRIPWNKGKHLPATTRAKLSKASSKAMKGMRWWNDGKVSRRALSCPAGCIAGRIK